MSAAVDSGVNVAEVPPSCASVGSTRSSSTRSTKCSKASKGSSIKKQVLEKCAPTVVRSRRRSSKSSHSTLSSMPSLSEAVLENVCRPGGGIKGLRAALYDKYSPMTARKWVQLVKDSGVTSVPTLRLVRIFDSCIVKNKANGPFRKKRAGTFSKSKDGTEKSRQLSYEEFGACIHRLAGVVYSDAFHPCSKLGYLHLQPLAARKGEHWLVSVSETAVLRWKEVGEICSGLNELYSRFSRHTPTRGGKAACKLSLSGWQSCMRSVGLFPGYLTLVGLQDAFFETLLDCSWEDCVCNKNQRGQIFELALSPHAFIEALCRAFIKSTYFRPRFNANDLVRLMDQFLFPRRYLRLYKGHYRVHSGRKASIGKRSLSNNNNREMSLGPDSDSDDASSCTGSAFSVTSSEKSEEEEGLSDNEGKQDWTLLNKSALARRTNRRVVSPTRKRCGAAENTFFSRFYAKCVDPKLRKVARLALLEFVRSSGRHVLGQRERELQQTCLRIEQAVEQNQKFQTASEQAGGTQKIGRGRAGEGFVSIEEHKVVVSKLEALQDALDLGGMADLDWDGTLEDAEAKMKDLIPLMMSEDPKEQMEASDKFEMLDKIVRNHKDFKLREQQKKEKWTADNHAPNQKALEELQAIFPKCIAEGSSLKDLTEIFNLTPKLAKRVFQRKALRLLHMSKEEIARCHIADLTTSFSTQGLDLRELRAVFASLPEEFSADGDGKKAAWRDGVLSQLQDRVKAQENGTLPKRQLKDPAYSTEPLKSSADATTTAGAAPALTPGAAVPKNFKLALDPKIAALGNTLAKGLGMGPSNQRPAVQRRASTSLLMACPIDTEAGLETTRTGGEESPAEKEAQDAVEEPIIVGSPKHQELTIPLSPTSPFPSPPPQPSTPPAPVFTEEKRRTLSKQSSISKFVQKCLEEEQNALAVASSDEKLVLGDEQGREKHEEVEEEKEEMRKNTSNDRATTSPKRTEPMTALSHLSSRLPMSPRSPWTARSEIQSPLVTELSAVLKMRRDCC